MSSVDVDLLPHRLKHILNHETRPRGPVTDGPSGPAFGVGGRPGSPGVDRAVEVTQSRNIQASVAGWLTSFRMPARIWSPGAAGPGRCRPIATRRVRPRRERSPRPSSAVACLLVPTDHVRRHGAHHCRQDDPADDRRLRRRRSATGAELGEHGARHQRDNGHQSENERCRARPIAEEPRVGAARVGRPVVRAAGWRSCPWFGADGQRLPQGGTKVLAVEDIGARAAQRVVQLVRDGAEMLGPGP